MAWKVVTASQSENFELAYDGYDPTWIIGAHNDPLPHWSYGPYAAAARYSMHISPYRSPSEHSYTGFFKEHDPHRRMLVPSYNGRAATPQVVVPGPGSGSVVVKAAKVVPIPSVTTVIYPHGQGHTLGTGHGHKNIVIMSIPNCCEGCEEKWKNGLVDIQGFKGVNVDRRHDGMVMRATVFGDMDTHSVVKAIKKCQPRAELWTGGPLR